MRSRSAAPAIGALGFALAFLASVPPELPQGRYSRALYSSDERLLGAFVSEDGQWHFPSGSAIDGKFKKAIVEFEDRRFYGHAGFDPRAIARAFVQNLSGGEIVSGGSTITMQAIRSARRGDRTLLEKCVELWYAVRLELALGKDAIIERYMADAPFGGNVIGVEAASFRYLGRSPGAMSWAEAAMLAVLPNSPSLIHLARGRDELDAKRDRLLARLDAVGALPEGELALALAEPLAGEPHAIPLIAPHLLLRSAKDFPRAPAS